MRFSFGMRGVNGDLECPRWFGVGREKNWPRSSSVLVKELACLTVTCKSTVAPWNQMCVEVQV